MHRVFVFAGAHDGDADDGGDEVDRLNDQGKENALDPEDREEGGTQDHCADVFCGGGLEDVCATAGAVAYVVTDEVGDDGRVARVVLGDAGLDFADEVSADVGSLGVDAAAKLREESDQRSAEAEADQLIRRRPRLFEAAEEEEEDADAEEGERNDDESGDGSATQGGLQGATEAGARGAGGADVGPDGDEHAGKAREARADGADEKADDYFIGEGSCKGREPIANVQKDGEHHCDNGDGAILPGHEGLCPFPDGIGDGLHLLRPGIHREDGSGEEECNQEAEDADYQRAPQINTAVVWGTGGAHLEPQGPQADILHASSPKELSWCAPSVPPERARGKAAGSRNAD